VSNNLNCGEDGEIVLNRRGEKKKMLNNARDSGRSREKHVDGQPEGQMRGKAIFDVRLEDGEWQIVTEPLGAEKNQENVCHRVDRQNWN